MKKTLLITGVLAGAAISANAQGVSAITDDFAADFFTDTAQVWSPSEKGIYWFNGDVAGKYEFTRNAEEEVLEVATVVVAEPGCSPNCAYDPFGFVFGNDTVTDAPFTLDVSAMGAAMLTLVVENPSDSALRITAQMKDANGKQVEIMYEDTTQIPATEYYEWGTWRWKKFQQTIAPGATDTLVFDMNKAFTLFPADTAWRCTYPGNCPYVDDEFDFSQISTVLFMANAGAGSKDEFFDDGTTSVTGYEDTFKIHSMTLGIPSDVGTGIEHSLTNVAGFNVSPNPAADVARMSYTLTENTQVSLTVFDALGRQVETLVNAEQVAGVYNVNYDVANSNEGVYFYVLRAGNETMTRKLIVSKK